MTAIIPRLHRYGHRFVDIELGPATLHVHDLEPAILSGLVEALDRAAVMDRKGWYCKCLTPDLLVGNVVLPESRSRGGASGVRLALPTLALNLTRDEAQSLATTLRQYLGTLEGEAAARASEPTTFAETPICPH